MRCAHAKHADRIRGFYDESMTVIEYVRNVVGFRSGPCRQRIDGEGWRSEPTSYNSG